MFLLLETNTCFFNYTIICFTIPLHFIISTHLIDFTIDATSILAVTILIALEKIILWNFS